MAQFITGHLSILQLVRNFRLRSSLFIANPPNKIKELFPIQPPHWIRTNYYQWTNNRFILLKSISPYEQLVKELILKEYPDSQNRNIELLPLKKNDSLFAAIFIFEDNWWENLRIGKLVNGEILWLPLQLGDIKMANYIIEAHWIEIQGFINPILEVYDSTHMGNGSLYLFEMDEKKLQSKLLLESRAVDSYLDNASHPLKCGNRSFGGSSSVFRGGKLETVYGDFNSDNYDDVELNGIVDIYCNDEYVSDGIESIDYLYKSVPVQIVFLWDIKEYKFSEDITKTTGFDAWHKLIEDGSLIEL